MAIPVLDPPLLTDTRSDFATKAQVLAEGLPDFATEANALAVTVQTNASNAIAAAGALANTIWISGTTYAVGDVRYSPSNYQNYRRITNGAGTTDPASDGTNWRLFNIARGEIRTVRTSNTILTSADWGVYFDVTSGTFTQTFSPAATLGAGWWVRVKNSGSGEVTLDPDSAETIDGLATFIMYPGETRLIYSDGTNLLSIVENAFFAQFTASGTFPKPPGYKMFGSRVWSGGQSGQRNNNVAAVSIGGAGGGCTEGILPASLFAAIETITVGAGGAEVSTVANGNIGGDSSIGTLVVAYAGNTFGNGGGVFDGIYEQATNGTECVYSGAQASTTPRNGIFGGGSASIDASAIGAQCLFGGACGGSLTAAAALRAAGTSKYGGNGGAAASATNGVAGTAPGGGGGATQTGTNSGAGARGEVWIWGIM